MKANVRCPRAHLETPVMRCFCSFWALLYCGLVSCAVSHYECCFLRTLMIILVLEKGKKLFAVFDARGLFLSLFKACGWIPTGSWSRSRCFSASSLCKGDRTNMYTTWKVGRVRTWVYDAACNEIIHNIWVILKPLHSAQSWITFLASELKHMFEQSVSVSSLPLF